MEQRLSLVTLGVSDLARARSFYEGLGWKSNTPAELDVVFFQLGGMVLSLWNRENLAEDCAIPSGSGFGGVALAYNVRSEADVDTAIADAEAAGATITRAPSTTFWGGYSGVFVDPDGHPWEVAHNPRWEIAPDGSVKLPA